MTKRLDGLTLVLTAVCAWLGAVGSPQAASQPPRAAQKGVLMSNRAAGTFEVKLSPQATDDKGGGLVLGRMSIDKVFHGDLEGTSLGEMLTAGTGVEGSAGYVAIELVTGTLGGRPGSFVLQHTGTLTRGAPELTIRVVPDSGTDQLVGLRGRMEIDMTGGGHAYAFEYTLPAKP